MGITQSGDITLQTGSFFGDDIGWGLHYPVLFKDM